MNHLTVKAASQLSGVAEHTLRAWERRYQAIEPSRTESGRRLYSMQDVDRLKLLAALLDQGYSIGVIAKLPDSDLRSMLGTLTVPTAQASGGQKFVQADPIARIHAAEIVHAVAEFQMDLMDQGLSRARAVLGVRSFVLDVVSPVLSEVGQRSILGEWTIAQEHAFSAILRDHLGQVLRSFGVFKAEGKAGAKAEAKKESLNDPRRVIFATPEGDHHEFGILLSAILFAAYPYQVFYLGANMPAAELARASAQLRAGRVVIGAVPSDRPVSVNDYILQVDHLLPNGVELWIGGPGFDSTARVPVRHPWIHITSLHQLDAMLRSAEEI